jgi:hypothetical protein
MRRIVLLLLTLGFVVALPGVARAHDVLERTTPAEGTTVDRLPGAVTLTFAEEPLPLGLQVVVTGPSGNVASGPPAIEGRDVVQALSATAPAGDYTVTYRVTSADGHPVSGSFSFHAAVGLDGSTATKGASVPAPPRDPAAEVARSSQFVPVMLSIATTVLLIAVGAFVVVRARGRA